MLIKASKVFLVAMLCVTLGFHWAVLQSVAWVGMVVSYSQEGSIKSAVCKTFDGKHPCPLCKLIREGKRSEKKPEAQTAGKMDLFAERGASFYFTPSMAKATPFSSVTIVRAEPPLLPPPRPFFG